MPLLKIELMKKFGFFLLAALCFAAVAAEPQLRRSTDLRQKSLSNLKAINYMIYCFADSRKDFLPPDFTELVYGGFVNPDELAKVFIAPHDRVSKVAQDQQIKAQNTSYVYVGKGMHLGRSNANLFIVFEDPAKLPENIDTVAVLYLNGKTALKKIPPQFRKNRRSVAEFLLKELPVAAAEKELILKNAADEQ